MPEATAAADFTMGLDADIMMFVQSMGPRTVQDAQRIARNVYEGKKVAGHTRQTYAMETEVAALKESVMANNQLMNQLINPIVTQQMPPLQVQQPDQWNRVASDKTSGINNSRKGRPQFQSKKNMSEIICFKCGEKGHMRKDCLGERDLQAEQNNYFEQRNQRNAQVNNIEDTSEVNHMKRVAIPVVPEYNLLRNIFNHGVSLTFADMLQEPHYRKQVQQALNRYEQPIFNVEPTTAAHIYVSIKGNSFMGMLDIGSPISVISEKAAKKLKLIIEKADYPITITAFNGTATNNEGIIKNVPVIIKGQKLSTDMRMIKVDRKLFLLGTDWQKKHKIDIRYSTNTIEFMIGTQKHSASMYVTTEDKSYRIMGKPEHKPHEFQVNQLDVDYPNSAWTHTIEVSPEEDEHSTEIKQKIQAILNDFPEIVAKGEDDIGNCPVMKHRIYLTDDVPIRAKYKAFSPKEIEFIEKETERLEEIGAIKPSISNYSSNIVLVDKKNGSIKTAINYVPLNNKTVRNENLIPNTKEIFPMFGGAKCFTILDLKAAYWQVLLDEGDRHLTAFHTPTQGLYQWKVMPFGLSNAPATFQMIMNKVMRPHMRKFAYPYLDDIIIFSTNWKDHIQHVRMVLERIRAARLKIKPEKCDWFKRKISFLGHTISAEGITANDHNVTKIRKAKPSQNITQLRSFLGLCQYYKDLIPNLTQIAEPLFKRLRGGRKGKNKVIPNQPPEWKWDQDCQQSFEKLKEILTSEQVVAHPNFDKPFKVYTDASDTGIGAVLSQDDDEGKEKVIAYASRTLNATERNWIITEKECLAVVWAIEHFRTYLDTGKTFDIYTDYATLQTLRNHKEPTSKRA